MYAFLHPALTQTGDYSRSNYTCTPCTYFVIYHTPWNKGSLDVKHETGRNGGWIDGAMKESVANIIWWVNG